MASPLLLPLLIAGLALAALGISYSTSRDPLHDAAISPGRHPVLFVSKGIVEAQVLYKEPSVYGDIIVFDFGNVRCFLIDGANESCWNFTNNVPSEYVSDITFLLENSGEGIKDVLIVGMGAGTLLKELDGKDFRIDAVEINPKMPEVADKFFGLPKNLTYNIIVDDGRHYISQTSNRYDAIVLDICNVNEHNAHLWTKEFYALTQSLLKDPQKGIVIASRGMVTDEKTKKLDHMIANAVRQSFSNLYMTQRSAGGEDEYDVAVFLATNSVIPGFPDRWPVPKRWAFDLSYPPTTDAKLDEAVRLFQPATQKIREQTVHNFGQAILLP